MTREEKYVGQYKRHQHMISDDLNWDVKRKYDYIKQKQNAFDMITPNINHLTNSHKWHTFVRIIHEVIWDGDERVNGLDHRHNTIL